MLVRAVRQSQGWMIHARAIPLHSECRTSRHRRSLIKVNECSHVWARASLAWGLRAYRDDPLAELSVSLTSC